jgi:hypothetical protein
VELEARMPHVGAIAAAALTAAMITGLSASVAGAASITVAASPVTSAVPAGSPAGQSNCLWVPPLPTATTVDPVGHPFYPCGPK